MKQVNGGGADAPRQPMFHAAQQLLMGECTHIDLGQADGLQPAQHAKLGIRITPTIEHHHAYDMLNSCHIVGAAKDGAQRIKTDLLP